MCASRRSACSSTTDACSLSTISTRRNSRAFGVPVGGRVKFGETSRQAIVREVREELDTEILDLELLGVLENLFAFDGGNGHEIVFVYDARFAERVRYDARSLVGLEGDKAFEAHWIDPSAPAHDRPLYPEGLLNLIGTD